MFLQSYVVPCCTYSINNDKADIVSVEGTAFFINSKGVLLTARHVIEDGIATASKKNLILGIAVKGDSSG